jgi:uncharacterized membrane protein
MPLDILMRFLHIISAVTLIGGALAWRFGALPAIEPLAGDTKAKVGNAIAASLRPIVLTAMALLLLSGIYQYMMVANKTPAWNAVIGVKFLGVLHIFAVGFLVTGQNNQKRSRQLTGVVISGVIVIGLAATLHYLSSH